MKTLPLHSLLCPKIIWINLCRLTIGIACLVLLWMIVTPRAVSSGSPPDDAPLVAILTPRDDARLNAHLLRVQTLVAAFKSHAKETFVFNGQSVAGKNEGRVSRVELMIDGLFAQRIETIDYGPQLLADFRVDISRLSDGLHVLTVNAFGEPHATVASVSAMFTLDRRLPRPQVNRVEDAATPKPFSSLVLNLKPPKPMKQLDLDGEIVLGSQSDGLDLSKDRVVLAIGSQISSIEPGALKCKKGQNCSFKDDKRALIKELEFGLKKAGIWKFKLKGGTLSSGGAQRFYLRVGNDWGGLDLETGELLISSRPALDQGRMMQSVIGAGGGSIETFDAAGVRIILTVPAGALTQDQLIKVTPLQNSSLVNSSKSLFPGVKFEPEGLQFASPATLTLDLTNTDKTITEKHSIFLITSPMTMLPVYGSVNPANKKLTALVDHFSEVQPSEGEQSFSDLAAWASAVLSSGQNLTLSEIQSLAAVAAVQLQQGCEQNCIDVGQLTERVRQSINATVSSQCPLDTANPSDQALDRYLQLETIAQQFGVEVTGIRGCMEQILRALIERDGAAAIADPSYSTTLPRILELANRAQQLGFAELETLALRKVDAAMRVISQRLLGNVQQARGTDQEQAVTDQSRTGLEGALSFVQTSGAAVLTVAPTLDDDLQAAIESLSAPAMIVVVKSGFPSPSSAGAGQQFNMLDIDSPLPASVSASDGNAQSQWTMRRINNNSFAWDVDSSTAIQTYSSAMARVELTFTRAGTLTFNANPNWLTRERETNLGCYPISCEGVWVFGPTGGFSPSFLLYYQFRGIGLFVGDPFSSNSHTPGTMATVAISGPTTHTYLMMLPAQYDGSAGTGRLLTVTFTPQ